MKDIFQDLGSRFKFCFSLAFVITKFSSGRKQSRNLRKNNIRLNKDGVDGCSNRCVKRNSIYYLQMSLMSFDLLPNFQYHLFQIHRRYYSSVIKKIDLLMIVAVVVVQQIKYFLVFLHP